MFVSLPTVRAKLTALVALSALVMLAALPVLSWLLHRQLVDEVDDRVTDAERAFQTELDDDLADLTLASRVLAADGATVRAVQNRDALGARHLAQMFVDVYPDIDVLIVDPGGSVLAQVGCVDPPSQIAGIVSMADLAAGKSVRGIGAHGCESPTSQAPPAFLLGASIEGGSGVVVCLPLDAGYLQNASAKLGLELALGVLPSASGARVVGHTPNFPAGALAVVSHESTIVDVGPRSWAVARFEPHGPVGALGQIGMIAALDVTDIRLIVRRNLAYALCALAVASALSLWIGWRVASVMSLALRRVSEALLRVERLDYVHVEPVKTGCRSDRDVGIAGISAS